MKREHRYTIFKVKDIKNYLPEYMQERLDSICDVINRCRASDNKPLLECVCVESDWPEYETVWGLIEARVDGKPNELDQLRAENEALKKQVSSYKLLTSSMEETKTYLLKKADQNKEAVDTLASEREANAVLTAENERLKAELADRTTLISRLNRELAIYREREKTMGWNQG